MIKDIDRKKHSEEKKAKRVEKVKQKTKNLKRNKLDWYSNSINVANDLARMRIA